MLHLLFENIMTYGLAISLQQGVHIEALYCLDVTSSDLGFRY